MKCFETGVKVKNFNDFIQKIESTNYLLSESEVFTVFTGKSQPRPCRIH